MKWLRWIGLSLVALVVVLAVAGIALYLVGGQKLGRTLTVDPLPIELPGDSLSITEGSRFARIFGCFDCHGEKLQGDVLVEDPILGKLIAPHIAPGEGSVTTNFETDDWVRAIRHGVGGDGRPLAVMPATSYVDYLSGADLANIIDYLRQLEPVDHHPGASRLLLAQVMVGAGLFQLEYDLIDHSKPFPPKASAADTMATGEHLAGTCRGCHGTDLMGSEEFGGPALARGGTLEAYDEATFMTLFRTGNAQNGRALDPKLMPWRNLGFMTDGEIHAVWTYLRTVPAAGP
jgi:mono/diheme cytochrome c family protein